MSLQQRVAMLGVPMDLGGGLRGVDMGPSAIRIAELAPRVRKLGLEFEDRGNVPVIRPEGHDPGDEHARFLQSITNCCERLHMRVRRILEDGAFPLVVGGDHSIACGTVAGIVDHHAERGERVGLIWFDAHADMNTPRTSPTGNIHGMPLACCLGKGPEPLVKLAGPVPMVDPERTVLIGIRDLDPEERDRVLASGVRAYSMREIDILGMDRVMSEAIELVTDGTAGFHLSFDLDGLDPDEAPGVGTPVPGGVSQREAHLMLEHAAESGKLLGFEVTELNPILDHGNRTGELARELILSALGKRIL